MIELVPEVLPDSEHQSVVLSLQTLMGQSVHLTAAVIDALSNLSLDPDMVIKVFFFS